MKRIYLDYAATTPLDPSVFLAMKPYLTEKFGNPSSVHSFGQEARKVIDDVRETVASFLDATPTEIIFTSGGSESDNLAIRGILHPLISSTRLPARQADRTQIKSNESKPHVVTSAIEHHAVLDTIKELENEGKIEATYVAPDKGGVISVGDVEKAIKDNTVLVSIMYVNNEIGTVQPIREIGKMLERINRIRYNVSGITQDNPDSRYPIRDTEKNLPQIFFHTDAVQATEYFNMSTKYLHVDLLTMTAHKIHGPKGVGVLFVKKGTPIKPQITGGGQEYKKRAGTENVAGIAGLKKAVELVENYRSSLSQILEVNSARTNSASSQPIKSVSNDKQTRLRDKLIAGIIDNIRGSELNGTDILRSPNNVNISFRGVEGESILLNLDMLGIAASTGSACTSGSLEPSHVITGIGYDEERAHSSIRFTLGRETTEEEIDRVTEVLPGIIKKLRAMSPIR